MFMCFFLFLVIGRVLYIFGRRGSEIYLKNYRCKDLNFCKKYNLGELYFEG